MHCHWCFVCVHFSNITGSGGSGRQMYAWKAWPQLNGTFHLMHSRVLTAYSTLEIIRKKQGTLTHTLEYPVNFKLSDLTIGYMTLRVYCCI